MTLGNMKELQEGTYKDSMLNLVIKFFKKFLKKGYYTASTTAVWLVEILRQCIDEALDGHLLWNISMT